MKQTRGFIVLISGPSGVGKGTIVKHLMNMPELRLFYSISATTRPKRYYEEDGVNYWFKTHAEFQNMIDDNQLLEYAKYLDNYYGTPLVAVNEILDRGDNLLLEIEYQGVKQVIEKFPDSLTIFVTPPSFDELRNRLAMRGSETAEIITQRIKKAEEELSIQGQIFKHNVVNDVLEDAINEIRSIILEAMHERANR